MWNVDAFRGLTAFLWLSLWDDGMSVQARFWIRRTGSDGREMCLALSGMFPLDFGLLRFFEKDRFGSGESALSSSEERGNRHIPCASIL